MLMARADSGKEMLECEPVDARVVMRGAVEQGEKLVRNHDLLFTADLPPAAIPIRADADALRRALLILIDNAAKYTPQGGSVTVCLAARNGYAVASVEDTGFGIAKEDAVHIFHRFWSADKARSLGHDAAALGWTIAQ